MFGLIRIARRIAENPKLLIALVVLLAFGIALDYYLVHGWGNPLPDPDDVQDVSFIGGAEQGGSSPQAVDIGLYGRLRECLAGSERIITGGMGEPTGTLVIRLADGSTHRATLYEWGLVGTDEGLFSTEGEANNRLCSLIWKIRQQAGQANL